MSHPKAIELGAKAILEFVERYQMANNLIVPALEHALMLAKARTTKRKKKR